MVDRHNLTAADILPMAEYDKVRAESRRKIAGRKQNRHVEVGPYVTFYFENYETMWLQVHEMVFIEKGGPEQVPEEIAAYNPLVPKGSELVATFMIEIDDPRRRAAVLSTLGGIENTAFIEVGGDRIFCRAEADQDRTREDGKASSVQFVHFDFSPGDIAAFRAPCAEVVLGFAHPNYGHMAVMPETVRAELVGDFDA
ncbi:conserved hypothetical protein [Methylocella tundrae]|uniref:DUF3501 domain-containing protein n=1 Tax=Methylocella tundrae TaxID=227605 RepID=A0A8B6M9D7_METTU|nr:DUF3501 family protein [Methylocella tundrae]VTZ51633.1 conserved hypothetical protein [Methylocella tundrae]